MNNYEEIDEDLIPAHRCEKCGTMCCRGEYFKNDCVFCEETMEKITEEFFKKRFPDKDIKFEKKCGYFGEWVSRLKSGYPERFMDEISLNVWEEMKIKVLQNPKGGNLK